MLKKTTENVIADFRKKHGERYGYSLVEYVNAKTKVKILCKFHGEFLQTPDSHTRGIGCPDCGGRTRYNDDKIIGKFQSVHSDLYDYSLVKYNGTNKNVIIKCPLHGVFEQMPSNHLRGAGCPVCSGVLRYDNDKIISKFQEIHGDRYNYTQVDYIKSDAKVKIICTNHGVFKQTPSSHLSGAGCPDCAGRFRYNNDKIISKFQLIHGDRYDYTLVNYINSQTKVKIKCQNHGVFEQTPGSHLSGAGCPDCGGLYHYDTEKIRDKFRTVHGDEYDYSHVQYVNAKTKVRIICKIHGEFLQSPTNHLNKQGCPACGLNRNADSLRKTQASVLEEFLNVHGDKYDYTLVDYISTHKKVKIICPFHGVFEQSPIIHLKGSECPECAGNFQYDNDKIITKFKLVHGDRYDYSMVQYLNALTKVRIICREHGEFEQIVNSHLRGSDCPECAGRYRYDNDQIIAKFQEVHGNRYEYSQVEYSNNSTKLKITCKIHGLFWQSSANHLKGKGCPVCNVGWSQARIIDFVNSIDNRDLLQMDAIELQMIISQGKLPDAINALVFSDDSNRDNSIKTLKEKLQQDTAFGDEDSEDLGEAVEFEPEKIDVDGVEESDLVCDISVPSDATQDPSLITLTDNFDDLHVLDNAIVASCDEEVVKFLIQYKLRKLWNKVLNDIVHVDKLREKRGGANFDLLKKHFFDEYDEVVSYTPPQGYSFQHTLNAMQQLTVYRMVKNRRYGNWSGTGAGKSISFIVASREVNAGLTILVCLNSTITQLCEAIVEVYPDSVIHTHYSKGYVFDKNQFNYLILNYDKFQQDYSEGLFQDLTHYNKIDFIAIDEVHNVKQRSEQQESIRRGTLKRLIGRASEHNPALYVLGMSATPVINNLTEAKSLLEMITGKEFDDLNTSRTLTNALEVFKQMTLNGLRYIPKYRLVMKELDGFNTPGLKIDGTHLSDKLLKIGNHNYLGAERLLLSDKLKAIQPYLRNGVVIYSYFTHRMIKPIVEYLTGLGYRVGTFTGDESMEFRNGYKEAFLHSKIDILVGSKPIGTGVDGLQKVCNRMIILSLPWTDSEYTQLKGRIYRQGSHFGEVEIIIPQIVIPLADREWSWDAQRMNLIRNKKTLADAAVDGVIPSRMLPTPETLFAKSIEALKEWRDRVNEGRLFRIDRKDIVFPLRPEIVDRIGSWIGDFSKVNRIWSISKSGTTHERLREHPEEWYYYHTLFAEKRKSWEEIPFVEIAKLIKRKDFIVADLGCGENLLRHEIPDNVVLSFDHVAIDQSVTACDINQLPLANESVDVAVFSLSLMGVNYDEYLFEAHRILKHMGFLFIAEPQGKWDGNHDKLERVIAKAGFAMPFIWVSGGFVYIRSEKF